MMAASKFFLLFCLIQLQATTFSRAVPSLRNHNFISITSKSDLIIFSMFIQWMLLSRVLNPTLYVQVVFVHTLNSFFITHSNTDKLNVHSEQQMEYFEVCQKIASSPLPHFKRWILPKWVCVWMWSVTAHAYNWMCARICAARKLSGKFSTPSHRHNIFYHNTCTQTYVHSIHSYWREREREEGGCVWKMMSTQECCVWTTNENELVYPEDRLSNYLFGCNLFSTIADKSGFRCFNRVIWPHVSAVISTDC